MFTSLLTPPVDTLNSRSAEPLSADAVRDLDIAELARRMDHPGTSQGAVTALLSELPQDAAAITYRQEVVRTLWDNPTLLAALSESVGPMRELTVFAHSGQETDKPLLEAVWRLGELELYVQLIRTLRDELAPFVRTTSPDGGIARLHDELQRRSDDPMFREMAATLPELRSGLKLHQSVTIGINLDNKLRPVEAALLSINSQPFREAQFLSSVFGAAGGDPYVTQTPLHSTPTAADLPGYASETLPLAPLFQELDTVMKAVLRPLARRLRAYVGVNTELLRHIAPEIAFYAAVITQLKEVEAAGYPLCFPHLLPASDRAVRFSGLYNLRLAAHWAAEGSSHEMVFNDVTFDDDARLYVLTGPNGGGKTTFTQAIGMAIVLGQNGFPVPAGEAEFSPVDRLYTHFAGEEDISDEIGRFEDEARRLSAIFDTVTSSSLILLNEPLASTGPHEAERIASAVLGGLSQAGVRGVFTTHFHQLAASADRIGEASRRAAQIGTLSAGVRIVNGRAERTYEIVSGAPSGQSYADDIARRYGIDRESLSRRLGG